MTTQYRARVHAEVMQSVVVQGCKTQTKTGHASYLLLKNTHTHTPLTFQWNVRTCLSGSEATELSPFLTEAFVILEGVIRVLLPRQHIRSAINSMCTGRLLRWKCHFNWTARVIVTEEGQAQLIIEVEETKRKRNKKYPVQGFFKHFQKQKHIHVCILTSSITFLLMDDDCTYVLYPQHLLLNLG